MNIRGHKIEVLFVAESPVILSVVAAQVMPPQRRWKQPHRTCGSQHPCKVRLLKMTDRSVIQIQNKTITVSFMLSTPLVFLKPTLTSRF
jgi:hypothetical protein